MVAPAVVPEEEQTAADPPRFSLVASSTVAAVAAVLAWFAVQLAQFVGEAPDLDAMISLRESIVFHREGLKGLIADRVGTGVHPPLMDGLTSLSFALFGEEPRSPQLLGVAFFALLAAAVERLLAQWLPAGQRVVGALVVAICPALAIVLFLASREGLVLVLLAVALAIALAPGEIGRARLVALGCVLALFPLLKDACLVLVVPFAIHAGFTAGPAWGERLRRGALVFAFPIVAALLWRVVLKLAGGSAWNTWIISENADDGPFVVAFRAMFGMERGITLRQNLANAFIVNWLWLPTLLAIVTVVLVVRRRPPAPMVRALALIGGLALLFTWTTLTFPTFTVPRYATPLILLTLLAVLVGLPLWPRALRPVVLGALLLAFALGAWSPTDPVSRELFGTTTVGGERIYDTEQLDRGPDRMVVNFAALRATERMNARLRRVFASGATMVTGDCDAMKFGEKLFSVGFTASVYDRGIPGARPLQCVRPNELPAGAANGKDKIALVRTVEEDKQNQPPAVTGSAIVVIH